MPEYCGGLLPLLKCGIRNEFLHYIWLKMTRVQVLMASYSCNVFKCSRHTYFQVGKPRQTGVCYLCRREREFEECSCETGLLYPGTHPFQRFSPHNLATSLWTNSATSSLLFTSFLLPLGQDKAILLLSPRDQCKWWAFPPFSDTIQRHLLQSEASSI